MVWLNPRLRRMAVSAALLVLCVVDASLVGARTASDYTAAQQASTLQFLQGFVTANPSLSAVWTGTDFCSWSYVSCSSYSPSLDFADYCYPAYSGTLVLPELGDDVDGSAVIFTEIKVCSMGVRVTGTLPASWGRLTKLETLYLDGNGLTGTLPSAWGGMASLRALNVSGSRLSGSVPASWGGLWQLRSVDLTGTGLCGCVPAEWAGKAVAADAALTGSDCASANACPAETSAPAPPPSRKTKSGPNLIPLWCVLGALGGVLVGVAVGLGVRFYRRRRREEELRLFQAQQDNEMEPFRKTTDTPY